MHGNIYPDRHFVESALGAGTAGGVQPDGRCQAGSTPFGDGEISNGGDAE